MNKFPLPYLIKLTINSFSYATSDYGARQYSAEFCQWMQVDPLAEKYYSTTPYGFCNGNALRYVDTDGCEFTENAWVWVNKLISNIDIRQERNEEKIFQLQSRIDAGGISARQEGRLNRQISRLQGINSQLEDVRSEIGVLAASDQVYDIISNNSYSSADSYIGASFYNEKSNVFEMHVPTNAGLGLVAHELKHGYQFEIGNFSTGQYKNGAPFYDQTDEIEAYARGTLFGGEHLSILPSIYSNLQKESQNVRMLPPIILNNPTLLQKYANNSHSAFRYNGRTYNGIKRK